MKRFLYLLPFALIVPLLLLVFQPTQAQTARQSAYLTVVSAKVEVLRIETTRWTTVNAETIVGVGDRIRTDANGSARISILGGNAVVEIEPNTELVINALDDTENGGFSTSIEIAQGAVSQSASETVGVDTSFELVSGSTALVLRSGAIDMRVNADGGADVLATVGSVFVFAGGNVQEIAAGSGVRAQADGKLSDVLPVNTFEQLTAGLDGATATFSSPSDVRLNVRSGPNREQTTLGTIDPTGITNVNGISADGEWFRVTFQNGYGWVNSTGFTVNVQRNLLVIFPNDFVEAAPVASSSNVAVSAPTPPPVEEVSAEDIYDTAVATALQGNTLEELTVVAELNQWRMDVGLWPLRTNPILQRLAADQARYIMSLPSFPDDTHKDAKGRYVRERAVSSEYGWPTYGVSARVSVGENVYVGANVKAAINWWRGSTIHNQTVVNPAYREVGVAALPHRFGSLYVVVFGGRPNIFPAMVDPLSNTLMLSQERYQYAPGGDWIGEVQQVQFVPTVLTQLNDGAWQPWSSQTSVPMNGKFVVAFQDGAKRVLLEINPITDVAWLPSNLPSQDQVSQISAEPPKSTPVAPSAPAAIIPTALPTNTPFR